MLTKDQLERESYEARHKWKLDEISRERTAWRAGAYVGRITVYREILGLPPLSDDDFTMLGWEGLEQMAESLARQVRSRSSPGAKPDPAP